MPTDQPGDENRDFADLVARVRLGNVDAVNELIRDYEPMIRRSIRLRLRDPRVRRVLDSSDICQSVLASFCVRAAQGQYELGEPQQLPKLLYAMVRNKLAHQIQKLRAARRDYRREEPLNDRGAEPVAAGDSPSQLASRYELLRELHRRLSAEERSILALRDAGRDWTAIASELGGTPDGRRMQLNRALNRISDELHVHSLD